jgi:hypothetical protein
MGARSNHLLSNSKFFIGNNASVTIVFFHDEIGEYVLAILAKSNFLYINRIFRLRSSLRAFVVFTFVRPAIAGAIP